MQTSAVAEIEETNTKATDLIDTTMVRISEIQIDSRKRELSEGKVAVLSDSIKVLGLLQPIVLTKDLHLIAGRHRVSAYEKLGFTVIPAILKEYNTLDKELAEIDENLVRFDLTDMERSIQVARRKQIYGLKFPQTLDNKRREELRKQWEEEGKPSDNPELPNFDSEDAQRDDVKSFIQDTAEKSGRSSTQIRDEANLGKALLDESLNPEIRDLLSRTPAAENKSDLKRLVAESDTDIQYEAAKAVNESYEDWVANGSNEKEKSRIVKLGDILTQLQLQKNPSTDTGEDILHKTLQKTLKALELSVGNSKFREVAGTWTTEGLDDIREDLFRIEGLATRGSDILTELMEKSEKLGKGKGGSK